jgi:hypothetical protein
MWLFACPATAQFYRFETDALRLVYFDKGHSYLVPHLGRCFHNALGFHSRLFDFTPSEKITVLLEDFGDYGNGGATPVPKDLIKCGIAPFAYTYETFPATERLNALMNHELMHIVALDGATTGDRMWQKLLFGKVYPSNEDPLSMFYSYLTTPRRYAPRWYHEGIAVFLETWMAGGLGRAMGNYDEMVFRTMVLDSSYIYDQVGLESEGTTIDFMVKANSYLYGTRFMNYMALQHGPEKLIQWVARRDGSSRYYSSQFENVYGRSLDDAWADWIDWEHRFQRENLDSLHLHPITPYRFVSREPIGSVSRAFYDSSLGKIFAGVNYPGQVAHIASIDVRSGRIDNICDVKGAALYYVASVAYDPTSQQLFFTTDNKKWRDLNVVNVRTGKSRTLLVDVRTGDLAFNVADRSLWGVRHFNGISTIVRIPEPYTEWNQVYSLPYGKDFFDIDISPDGTLLVGAMSEIDGTQRLVLMHTTKLLAGDQSYEELYDFEGNSPANFSFTQSGQHLFGSSYYSGVSNIVRYDLAQKRMDWISNTETGLFRPISFTSDSLIAFKYTSKGFVPIIMPIRIVEDVSAIKILGNEVVERYPILKRWQLKPPSPSTINIDSLTTSKGEYGSFSSLSVTSGYPIVEGYKNFVGYGFRLNLMDPILLSDLRVNASYVPNSRLPQSERFHSSFAFRHFRWKVAGSYNNADFYDLFGPTKTSRKGYSLSTQYKEFLVFDDPKTVDYAIRLAAYWDLERLPDFQNISTSYDRFFASTASINYQYFLQSLGAVEEEKGVRFQAIGHSYLVNGKFFPHVYGNFDYGILLPWNHSSLWLRTSAGFAAGDRRDPFANFYFGGFGNNWVDYQAARRYREYYSFPGVGLNDIGGTNYGKVTTEWVLPPVRFRRAGFSSVYCNWSQLTLFSGGIVTNIDSERFRRSVLNVGAQLDFKLVIFSILESTLSVGCAAAVERDKRLSSEIMASLKLLR